MIKKHYIKNILVITLSNIGDVILTLPAVNALKNNFPGAKIDIIVGERALGVIPASESIRNVIVYNKKDTISDKIGFISKLRKNKYNLVVDFRNTIIPLLLRPAYRTSIIKRPPKSISNMYKRHMWKLNSLGIDTKTIDKSYPVSEYDKKYIDGLLEDFHKNKNLYIGIAPGAKSDTKKWPVRNFLEISNLIIKRLNAKIIFVGDKYDKSSIEQITSRLSPDSFFDLSGQTTLRQLSYILKNKISLLISNDSAIMHMGWLMDIPVVSIFGPTDPQKYAPEGPVYTALKSNISCSPCEKAQCERGDLKCMNDIDAETVFESAKKILNKQEE